MERNTGPSAPQAAGERSFASDQLCLVSVAVAAGPCHLSPKPSYCTTDELQIGLHALKSILAPREVAEPFLELSVGLDSLHIRTARLLAARGSGKVSAYAVERGAGKGNIMQRKGGSLWQLRCLCP